MFVYSFVSHNVTSFSPQVFGSHSGPGSNNNERVLHILQSSTTGAWQSDCLVLFPGHSLKGLTLLQRWSRPILDSLPTGLIGLECNLNEDSGKTMQLFYITFKKCAKNSMHKNLDAKTLINTYELYWEHDIKTNGLGRLSVYRKLIFLLLCFPQVLKHISPYSKK